MDFDTILATTVLPLLGVPDDDPKYMICLRNAIEAVREYVHNDRIDVTELYPYQIAQLIIYYYRSFDDMNIQSKSQGNRSISYSANKGIPDDIKSTLPRYVKRF